MNAQKKNAQNHIRLRYNSTVKGEKSIKKGGTKYQEENHKLHAHVQSRKKQTEKMPKKNCNRAGNWLWDTLVTAFPNIVLYTYVLTQKLPVIIKKVIL